MNGAAVESDIARTNTRAGRRRAAKAFAVVGVDLRGVTLRPKGGKDAASDVFVPWEQVAVDPPEGCTRLFDEDGDPLRHQGSKIRFTQHLGTGDIAWAERIQALRIRRLMRDGTLRMVINRRHPLRVSDGESNAYTMILGVCFVGATSIAIMLCSSFQHWLDIFKVLHGILLILVTGSAFFGWLYLQRSERSSRRSVRIEVTGSTIALTRQDRSVQVLRPDACRPHRVRGSLVRFHLPDGSIVTPRAFDGRESAVWMEFARQAGVPRLSRRSKARMPLWKSMLIVQVLLLSMTLSFWGGMLECVLGRAQHVNLTISAFGVAVLLHIAAGGLWFALKRSALTKGASHDRYGQRLVGVPSAARPEVPVP